MLEIVRVIIIIRPDHSTS